MQKIISVKELIAKSRFALRTDFFDVKVVSHAILPLDSREATFLFSDATPQKQRLVIAVPRRVGSAPVRNRSRRRIKELIRTMGLAALSYDLIFFVRKSCATMPIQQLRDFMENLRTRVQKLSAKPRP